MSYATTPTPIVVKKREKKNLTPISTASSAAAAGASGKAALGGRHVKPAAADLVAAAAANAGAHAHGRRALVIKHHGEGSGASGGRDGLICTRRRERDGQGLLTMSLV